YQIPLLWHRASALAELRGDVGERQIALDTTRSRTLSCFGERKGGNMGTTLETAPARAAVTPVEALNRLVDIMTAYCSTQAFVAACKLGLFEQLSEGPSCAEDLARRTNIHPVGCRRLLVALAKLGLVDRDGELFRNSAVGHYCSSKASVDLSAI